MGKLRTEPKQKSFLTQDEYKALLNTLKDAQKAASDNHVYFDLESNEKPAQIKKSFNFVARKEGIDVTVRQVRGTRSLAFKFVKSRGNSRMSADESQARILKCLKTSKKPLKKRVFQLQLGIFGLRNS